MKANRSMQRVNMALARGSSTSALRCIDLAEPATWEFSGFSQNGEDGIIDVLTRHIKNSNRYFIEIGASDGIENNTAWLAIARRYSGMWIEGNQATSDWCSYLFASLNYGVDSISMFVTKDNAIQISEKSLYLNPDVFSLDIDGNDYYIAEAILSTGLKPKVFVVEYNSAFGPDMNMTIPYQESFQVKRGSGNNLYYGCSISAWKILFERFGYTFITVDTNGVNAVFIDSNEFDPSFIKHIHSRNFAENFSQFREYRMNWSQQFALISCKDFVQID